MWWWYYDNTCIFYSDGFIQKIRTFVLNEYWNEFHFHVFFFQLVLTRIEQRMRESTLTYDDSETFPRIIRHDSHGHKNEIIAVQVADTSCWNDMTIAADQLSHYENGILLPCVYVTKTTYCIEWSEFEFFMYFFQFNFEVFTRTACQQRLEKTRLLMTTLKHFRE